jgi:hypothetical protein
MSPIPMRSSPPAFYSRSHEHFLLGVARTSRPVPLASESLAWSEHLYRRRKCAVRPRNVPKRCISAMAAKDGARYLPRLACRSLTVRREERGRKIGSGPVARISRLIGGVGIGARLDRRAIEMPRRVAEHRNHYRKAKEERYRSDHQ